MEYNSFYSDLAYVQECVDDRYESNMTKIHNYCNHLMDSMYINKKNIELRAITESMDSSTVAYYINEAEEGALTKLKEMIKKIIATFVQFVQDVKLKIVTTIASAEVRSKIDKMEKAIKFNPFAKGRVIEIEDVVSENKVLNNASRDVFKIVAKLKGGVTPDAEQFDELVEETNQKLDTYKTKARLKVKADVALKSISGMKLSAEIDQVQAVTKKLLEEIDKYADDNYPQYNPFLTKAASTISGFGREAVNCWTRWFKDTMAAIASALKVTGSETADKIIGRYGAPEPKTESYDYGRFFSNDNYNNYDTSYESGYEDYMDAASYFEDNTLGYDGYPTQSSYDLDDYAGVTTDTDDYPDIDVDYSTESFDDYGFRF